MLSIDGSLFIQIANFIFLIWALNIVLYRPIRRILNQRQEKMDGFKENIAAFVANAKQKDEAFISGVKEARAKGLKEKESLLFDAAEEEKKIIQRINQKAQADLADLKEKVARDSAAVRESLQAEIDDFANAIGQKILGRTI